MVFALPAQSQDGSWASNQSSRDFCGSCALLLGGGRRRAQGGDIAGRGPRALTAHFWPFSPRLCAWAHREGWVSLLAIRKGHRGLPQEEAEEGPFQVNRGFMIGEAAFHMGRLGAGESSRPSGRVFAELTSSFTWFRQPVLCRSPGTKA